jgi:hypothetical protein
LPRREAYPNVWHNFQGLRCVSRTLPTTGKSFPIKPRPVVARPESRGHRSRGAPGGIAAPVCVPAEASSEWHPAISHLAHFMVLTP